MHNALQKNCLVSSVKQHPKRTMALGLTIMAAGATAGLSAISAPQTLQSPLWISGLISEVIGSSVAIFGLMADILKETAATLQNDNESVEIRSSRGRSLSNTDEVNPEDVVALVDPAANQVNQLV